MLSVPFICDSFLLTFTLENAMEDRNTILRKVVALAESSIFM